MSDVHGPPLVSRKLSVDDDVKTIHILFFSDAVRPPPVLWWNITASPLWGSAALAPSELGFLTEFD